MVITETKIDWLCNVRTPPTSIESQWHESGCDCNIEAYNKLAACSLDFRPYYYRVCKNKKDREREISVNTPICTQTHICFSLIMKRTWWNMSETSTERSNKLQHLNLKKLNLCVC